MAGRCARCGSPSASGRVINGQVIYVCRACTPDLKAAIDKRKGKR